MLLSTVADAARLARARRRELGFSQSQLAEMVGVSRKFISQFEAGKESVQLGLVLAVYRALALSIVAEGTRLDGQDLAPDQRRVECAKGQRS